MRETHVLLDPLRACLEGRKRGFHLAEITYIPDFDGDEDQGTLKNTPLRVWEDKYVSYRSTEEV